MADNFFSTSEARKILSDLVNQVKYQGKEFSIGRHGKAEAKLIPVESENESVQPTKELDFHEHIRNQRIMRNKTVKYDSHAFKYEYAKLAKKYDLKLMVLFGSHANGKVRPDSDVDIAVVPKKELTHNSEQSLYCDLVDLLGRDDIDLINFGRTSDVLLSYNVFMEGKVLYQENAKIFDHLKKRAWFDYQDFGKYFDLMDKATLKRLKKLQSLT